MRMLLTQRVSCEDEQSKAIAPTTRYEGTY